MIWIDVPESTAGTMTMPARQQASASSADHLRRREPVTLTRRLCGVAHPPPLIQFDETETGDEGLYVESMYNSAMATKSERWNLRVTPGQDAIVRRVLDATGLSLNEYVVTRTVAAATNDMADRQIFVLDPHAWDELQETLNRPPAPNPAIAALLAQPSVLEDE